MTTNIAPTAPSVSFNITPGEFELLATFMAPLHFNESAGASIWVTSHDGIREWLVTASGITTVVFSRENELGRTGIESGESWAFPVPEHLLVTMGKFSISSDEMLITLSDLTVSLSSDRYSMTVSQNPHAKCPPVVPEVESLLEVNVEPVGLWTMLSSARVWPTGGKANGMNTPLHCLADFDRGQLVFRADWSIVEAGVHEYRMPAEFAPRTEGVEITPFAVAHSAILRVLRDPASAEKFGTITLHWSPDAMKHMKLSGENWAVYVPTIPNVAQWGHDLDEVVGDITYIWEDCSRISMVFPDLDKGFIELHALPKEPRFGIYKYRASYEILADVIPTVELYRELNALTEGTAGCRVIVDDNRLVAVCDLTQENYQQLNAHIHAFSQSVGSLEPLLSAISSVS